MTAAFPRRQGCVIEGFESLLQGVPSSALKGKVARKWPSSQYHGQGVVQMVKRFTARLCSGPLRPGAVPGPHVRLFARACAFPTACPSRFAATTTSCSAAG